MNKPYFLNIKEKYQKILIMINGDVRISRPQVFW